MGTYQRPHSLRRRAALVATAALSALTFAPPAAAAEPDGPLPGRAFAPVMESTVRGDLLLAGNSNLISAGGWRDGATTAADVDGDRTNLCSLGLGTGGPFDLANLGRWLCADNSSSAELDLPAGARVVAARLYVETSVRPHLGPLRVRLDGPGDGFEYESLTAAEDVARSPKLYEAAGGGRDGAALRQAVWDVTAFVNAAGPGPYTVADIVNERVGPFLPYASWAIVAAYELDPALDADGRAAGDPRFAPRYLSWHDGFQHLDAASLDVPIRPPDVSLSAAPFAKSFHVVARGRSGRSDNLLFADAPLGNNNAPGNSPPPAGVTLGDDPACNTVADVQNDSICRLGTTVATKTPGATAFRSSGDGATPSSGSGVDMDVLRIPDALLRAAGPAPVLQVLATGGDALAAGAIAVSIDLPGGATP